MIRRWKKRKGIRKRRSRVFLGMFDPLICFLDWSCSRLILPPASFIRNPFAVKPPLLTPFLHPILPFLS
jgi:hypothetical protein